MTLFATIPLALAALARNRLRSLLTALGVIIGVGSVIMMMSMGQGATAYVGETISGLGTNMLMIMPGSPARGGGGIGAPLFAPADVDAVRREAHHVGALALANSRALRLVAGGSNRTAQVVGATPAYFHIRSWLAEEGRDLGEEDERQALSVCVIGATVANELFTEPYPIGKELRIRDITCRVIGVLEAKGASFGQDMDDVVFMPYSTFSRRIAGSDRVALMIASATSADNIETAKEEIASVLRGRRHIQMGDEDDFAVRDPREIQAILENITGVLTLLLAGIAAISLLVGGIGIMNIMLVSVTERTREVGVRLAVGARTRDILTQFIVEAVVLSAAGGLLGILVGLAGALAVSAGLGIPYVVPTFTIPVAAGVSVLIGVIFGVVPARKAAKLNPLAALRFE